jgi:hypothetical protein
LLHYFVIARRLTLIVIYTCRYRRKRDKLVERASAARIPTMWGPFTSYCYRSLLDGIEHIAMVKVSISCVYKYILCRITYILSHLVITLQSPDMYNNPA